MDNSSNSRRADEDEARVKTEEVLFCFFLFFCSLDQWQKTLAGGAGGLGGSVSMATSQLGTHCKSKREGDIKRMNDEERKGGWSEMRREVKTKKKRGEEETEFSFSLYLLTVWDTLRQ